MNYWEECISEALEDAGITASQQQIDIVASWVEGAHDNYGTAMGYDAIPNPLVSEIESLKAAHKKELARLEEEAYRSRKYANEQIRSRNYRIESLNEALQDAKNK